MSECDVTSPRSEVVLRTRNGAANVVRTSWKGRQRLTITVEDVAPGRAVAATTGIAGGTLAENLETVTTNPLPLRRHLIRLNRLQILTKTPYPLLTHRLLKTDHGVLNHPYRLLPRIR